LSIIDSYYLPSDRIRKSNFDDFFSLVLSVVNTVEKEREHPACDYVPDSPHRSDRRSTPDALQLRQQDDQSEARVLYTHFERQGATHRRLL
jgi:hypothetical protein